MPAPPGITAHKPHWHRDHAWKHPVRVATTTAGTLASSFENGDTVDDVTLATGDRILVKDQSAGAENGIYVVEASGAPTRAYDMDANTEVVGAVVYVVAGTDNGGTLWRCTNTATPTLNTTALVWEEIETGGGGTPASTVEDETTWGIAPAVGTGTAYAREDHTHGTPPEPSASISGVAFAIVAVFDAGTEAITGNPEVDVIVPAAGTITGWTLLADATGSAEIDIYSDTYGNYPPTSGDSIVAAAPPAISSATKATDATLSGWDTSLSAGDILRFHLNSSSSVKRLSLTLHYTRT